MLGLMRDMREPAPETPAEIAGHSAEALAAMCGRAEPEAGPTQTQDTAAEAAQTGDDGNAGDPKPAREARGRGQGDPQGGRSDRRAWQGARNNGAERVGKVDPVLRVGG